MRLTQKENTRGSGNQAMTRLGLGSGSEAVGARQGGRGGVWVGSSIKKSHAFVIFSPIFSLVSLFFYSKENS